MGRSLRRDGREVKVVLREKGPTAIGMFGSGQWTIFEGYAATKLMRAGFRSNNLDPNARHCMASAAVAFMRTFGMDEPMGCYDDFERPMLSCFGARTWPRCTRSFGPALPTAGWDIRMCAARCFPPSPTARWIWPTFQSCLNPAPTSLFSTISLTTSSRPAA